MDLLQQIIAVRARAKVAIDEPRHNPYLPVLIQYFDLAEEILREGKRHPRYSLEERQRMLGGFGKIALDDYAFAEGELGQAMFEVMNRFAEGTAEP